jgi:Domain of unknown function (DUF4258)
MECSSIVFSGHAVRRIFERSLAELDVLQVIAQGEVIEEDPSDTPYPSSFAS